MESYDFIEKEKYRMRCWAQIEKRCRVPKALTRAVFLDTREALETEFLLRRGYRPENLLAVNREPIEVALLSKKLDKSGFPRVKTAGVDWLRAVSDRCDNFHVLQFDGTSCLHDSLIADIRESLKSSGASVVAVNMLAGREQGFYGECVTEKAESLADDLFLPTATTYGTQVRRSHAVRVNVFLWLMTVARPSECFVHLESVAWDTYKSTSGQTMLWFVAEVAPHKALPFHKDVNRRSDMAAMRRSTSFGCCPACWQTGEHSEKSTQNIERIEKILGRESVGASA